MTLSESAEHHAEGTERNEEATYSATIHTLHKRCGVYTRPATVSSVLDMVEWRADCDLASARLLEPAAGEGEFVVQAAERLVDSVRQIGVEPRAADLRTRITAFEIYAPAADRARRRVVRKLVSMGVHRATAKACATAWIRTGDYLLSEPGPERYTHVVGNPPYVRWNKVPDRLRIVYEERLPAETTRGDLYLPFLDRSFEELKADGRCGFVCSDRWQFTAYGSGFRKKWLSRLEVLSNERVDTAQAFERKVSAYANMFVASKRAHGQGSERRVRPRHPQRGRTLTERGCVIRVGPALGVTSAFVVNGSSEEVEEQLLLPWVDGCEVLEGRIAWRGRFVVEMFDEAGVLRDLRMYPRLALRLEGYRAALKERHVVRHGAPWYRTIDRVRAIDWKRPKILVPEIAKQPRVALDEAGRVPSHGVYAIFPPSDEVEAIYGALREGGLARGLADIAPTLKNGYVRCYKRFLSEVRI